MAVHINVNIRMRRVVAWMGLALLVAARGAIGQSPASDPADAALGPYLPEMQRLQRAGDAKGAEQVARTALADLERRAGKDSAAVAAALRWIAQALHQQGRDADAIPILRRALSIDERTRGSQNAVTAQDLNGLANLLWLQGKAAEAEPFARRALEARIQSLGPDHPETASSLYNLAEVLRGQGRDADAETFYRRALTVRQKVLGPDNGATLASVLGLARNLEKQHRYADAEPLYRSLLTVSERALGASHPATADRMNDVARVLDLQGRTAEAEALYRRALSIDVEKLGPQHPNTAVVLGNLAGIVKGQGHLVDAEALYRRSLEALEKARGSNSPELVTSLDNLAATVGAQGRHAEAEQLYRRALSICEQAVGPQHPNTANSLNNLALMLQSQGRPAEAEPLFRRALSIYETTLGPDHANTAAVLGNLAGLAMTQGRAAEAEPLYRRALAIDEKVRGPESPETAATLNNLAMMLVGERRYSEAEPLDRRSLAINEKVFGPNHPTTAASLNNLAGLLNHEGQASGAELLVRRALAIHERAGGAEGSNTALDLNSLAQLLTAQGHYSDADPMYRRALAILDKKLGAEHRITVGAHVNLARNDEYMGNFAEAVAHYRRGCPLRTSTARLRDQHGEATEVAQRQVSFCWTRLAFSLWGWAARGGGNAAEDHPDRLEREAFAAAQRGVQSAAGDAMARSAALTAANTAAVGAEARAYEAELARRDGLDAEFARAAGSGGPTAVERIETLAKARDASIAEIRRLEDQLKARAPRYWDYRSPEPIPVEALQATHGPAASLLRDDEALIMLVTGTGSDKGLVFAVTKTRLSWAQLGLTGDEIRARVARLRREIDPAGYGLRGLAVEQTTAPALREEPRGFDRNAAYELYQALLGNAAIRAVIDDRPVLLFVPSGALTSLPPGILITAPAPAEKATDDAARWRSTAWLLRSKAVALLPAVSSLTTLRVILPGERAAAPEPLLAFADPDFERDTGRSTARSTSRGARGFSSFFRDGVPLAEALDGLPRLPGTRTEGEALQHALHARPGSLLTGRDASKAQLMARNRDGRLSKVRVLEFATHGLVAGDASDLAEPALALAAGASPADELLLASEASTLRLNAEWVLLSACNTASPDAPEAQGLSGLSRAFFYAGARSLLVSHWRVRDDVAPRLIPEMLLAEQRNPAIGRAEALREATLAILDDTSLDAADPAAWAPFTLIGEAGR